MATAREKGGQETKHMGHKDWELYEDFTKWKRWDTWQNVAVRNPALWEQSMPEFQCALGR